MLGSKPFLLEEKPRRNRSSLLLGGFNNYAKIQGKGPALLPSPAGWVSPAEPEGSPRLFPALGEGVPRGCPGGGTFETAIPAYRALSVSGGLSLAVTGRECQINTG
jgi:hypothetical protein